MYCNSNSGCIFLCAEIFQRVCLPLPYQHLGVCNGIGVVNFRNALGGYGGKFPNRQRKSYKYA